jgi:hypothetical protein
MNPIVTRITLHLARPLLAEIADGHWHDLHARRRIAKRGTRIYLDIVRAGVADGRGFIEGRHEGDHLWIRITPKGRLALQ